MAPSTAVCFLIIAGVWLFSPRPGASLSRVMTCLASILLVMAFSILDVLKWSGIITLHVEDLVLPRPALLYGVPLARISPVTSILFVLISGAILLRFVRHSSAKRDPFLGHLSGLLASVTFLSGFTLLLGYVYGPLSCMGEKSFPSLQSTSMGFLFMSLAVLVRLQPDDIPKRYFLGSPVNRRLVRVFVPLAFFAALLQGIVSRFSPVFLDVNDALLSAIIAGSITLLAVVVSSKAASVVGRDIDRATRLLVRAKSGSACSYSSQEALLSC